MIFSNIFLSIFNISFTIEYHTYGLVDFKLYSKKKTKIFSFFWYKVWYQLLFKLYSGLWKNQQLSKLALE